MALASLMEMADQPAKDVGLHNDVAHKKLYVEMRDRFRNNRNAMEELQQWKDRNDDYDYPTL